MAADTEKASPARRINSSIFHQCVLFVPLYAIKTYRLLLSPWLGNQCRFHPSCSYYSEQALKRFGLLKGSWLTIKRLLKCHPWHAGGIDNIPDSSSNSSANNPINCNHN